MTPEEWMAQVRAWAASFPQREFVVDDSRETIYEAEEQEKPSEQG